MCLWAFFSPGFHPVLDRREGHRHPVVTPQMPTGRTIRSAVCDHEAHRRLEHPTAGMAAGQGQRGQIDIAIRATGGAVVRRIRDQQINRPPASYLAQGMQGAPAQGVARGQLPTSRARTVVVVVIFGHSNGLGHVVGVDDTLGGIGDIFTGSEHGMIS
jgi:hypothetical protein